MSFTQPPRLRLPLAREIRVNTTGLRPADSRGWLSPHFPLQSSIFQILICTMTDAELIHQFETDTLPDDSFHHADHVRLAFAYLSQYPVLEALEKFAAALKRYATARGQSQLYNETITLAYFFLIRERIARSATDNWEQFAVRNSDLLVWKNGILTRYYQEGTLQSDLARTVFLFPDKMC